MNHSRRSVKKRSRAERPDRLVAKRDKLATLLFIGAIALVAARWASSLLTGHQESIAGPQTALSAVLGSAATIVYGWNRRNRLVTLAAAATYLVVAAVEAIPQSQEQAWLKYSAAAAVAIALAVWITLVVRPSSRVRESAQARPH
jgi:peptidoglycan/LPS O-acetylase OafA/YrhL